MFAPKKYVMLQMREKYVMREEGKSGLEKRFWMENSRWLPPSHPADTPTKLDLVGKYKGREATPCKKGPVGPEDNFPRQQFA